MKRTASALALAAAVLLAPVVASGTASAAPYYPNCKAAFAAGVSNIHRGEAGYRPALDHDHDGVACEAESGSSGSHGSGADAQGVSSSHPSTGTHTGTAATTGSTGSSASTSTSGSSEDQVAVVPQGGAETGDGSTEGHTGWWITGVLLTSGAGLVGLATARRRRLAARRRAA